MTDNTVRAVVYLQVEPEFSRSGYLRDTLESVKGAKVVGYTQKRPLKPKGGTVEIKIEIDLPRSVFLPLRPEALVTIPETLTRAHPIEVEATDPNVPADDTE